MSEPAPGRAKRSTGLTGALAALLAALLSSCSAPAASGGRRPNGACGTPRSTTTAPVERALEWLLHHDPAWARSAGLASYAGKLPHLGRDALASRVAEGHALLAAASRAEAPTDDDALDRALVVHALRQEIFSLEARQEWRTNPLYYADLFAIGWYLEGGEAPPLRARALALHIAAGRREHRQAGAAFDLRSFHDAVLGHGAPPVPLLRSRVLAATPTGNMPRGAAGESAGGSHAPTLNRP